MTRDQADGVAQHRAQAVVALRHKRARGGKRGDKHENRRRRTGPTQAIRAESPCSNLECARHLERQGSGSKRQRQRSDELYPNDSNLVSGAGAVKRKREGGLAEFFLVTREKEQAAHTT